VTVSNLKAAIGDKQVNTVVEEKNKAKEKYDDAIAAGHVGIKSNIQKKVNNTKYLNIVIGNL